MHQTNAQKLNVVGSHSNILDICGIFQLKHSPLQNQAFSSEKKAPEMLVGWL